MAATTSLQTDTAGRSENKVTFPHRVPGTDQNELRIGWLPLCPYLCSDHFDPSCFHESVDLRNKFLGKAKRKLKADGAVPSTFLRCFTKLQDISRPCGALYFNIQKEKQNNLTTRFKKNTIYKILWPLSKESTRDTIHRHT